MPSDSTHTRSSTNASSGGTGGSNCQNRTSDNTNTSTDAASAPPLTSRPPGRNASSDNIGSSTMGSHQPQQDGDRPSEDRGRRAAHGPHLGQPQRLRGLEHHTPGPLDEEPVDHLAIDDPEQHPGACA